MDVSTRKRLGAWACSGFIGAAAFHRWGMGWRVFAATFVAQVVVNVAMLLFAGWCEQSREDAGHVR